MPDPNAQLKMPQVTFHTHPGGDDLDGDTTLTVLLKDAGNFVVAEFEGITGGFSDGSIRTQRLDLTNATGYRGRLIDPQPGTVTIEIEPHGGVWGSHDTWDFFPDVVLGFQGSDAQEETITFSRAPDYLRLVTTTGPARWPSSRVSRLLTLYPESESASWTVSPRSRRRSAWQRSCIGRGSSGRPLTATSAASLLPRPHLVGVHRWTAEPPHFPTGPRTDGESVW
jgi:hypothetical protein